MYSFKDYEQEAVRIRDYIKDKGAHYRTILDVACGTAQHAFYLKEDFRVDGIDLNPELISIANRKNPEGKYDVADMMDFQLHKKFDVVMCLFSSIGYVQTFENVVKTLQQFKAHLLDDGIILVEPWFTPEVWKAGRVDTNTAEHQGIKMCRMSHTQKVDKLSILRFEYLFGSETGIEYFTEEHKMGLFSVDEMSQAFHDVGLDVEYDQHGLIGRGMYIARRRKV